MDDQLLTVDDVARRLRVHPITVRRHISAGRLRAVRVGRRVRVRSEDLEAFLQPRVAEARMAYRAPTKKELEKRKLAAERLAALREEIGPIGIDTLDLIREGRKQLEQKYERWFKPGS